MDAIEPILPNPSILPEVQAAQRAAPVRRDGQRNDEPPGRQRRRRPPQPDVEVDVDGVTEPDQADADGTVIVPELPAPHRLDLTAGDEHEPPARRIDLTADDRDESPARRIDLTA